jgi:acyl carrier protein
VWNVAATIELPPIKDPEEPLHLDSLAVVRLIAFFDNDCGIEIEDEDLVTENFTTFRKLDDLIASESQAEESEKRDKNGAS